jgi:hypothetical protein
MTKPKTFAALLARVREFADAESRYQREADQRAAAESALETLEGQAALAEARAASLANELAEARGALSFARTVHARQRRWIIWGKLRRERDRHAVRRLRSERDGARTANAIARDDLARLRGTLDAQGLGYLRELDAMPPPYPSPPPASSPADDLSLPPGWRWEADGFSGWVAFDDRGQYAGAVRPEGFGGWLWSPSYGERGDQRPRLAPSELAARADLAAAVRRSFATEQPDHCSNDHASPSAFRALCTRTCSGAGDQPCTGEQSSPEPEWMTIGELVCAVDADGRELGQNFDGLDPCSPAQPARPIRAGQGGRGPGRFPRGGGRPGVSVASSGAHSGKVGQMGVVAKGGPSPVNGGSTAKQGDRARLRNTGCATGALNREPEPAAGAREGWFGVTGEGERVDPGGALRVAVAVLGAVDLVWWLCVRLLYLVGRRADEEPGRPGARYLGIGWQRAAVDGGALCEAWIGWVPIDAEPRDGWPVGWRWDASPLEPPGWSFNPECDDRAPEDPGSIGILVRGEDGRARLAAWSMPWGDRWTAPGFDAGRLVRLLRAEITDAELRAEERDDEGDEEDPEAPEPADVPPPAWKAELSAPFELPPLPGDLVWRIESDRVRVVGFYDAPELPAKAVLIPPIPSSPNPSAWTWKIALRPTTEGTKNTAQEAAEAIASGIWWRCGGDGDAAATAATDERPPATCRTGEPPVDPRVADLPPLPAGYRWRALTDTAAGAEWDDGLRRTVFDAELRPSSEDQGAAWSWFVVGCARLGPSAAGHYKDRQEAAKRIARELRRRVDEAATRDGLKRQAEGGQS